MKKNTMIGLIALLAALMAVPTFAFALNVEGNEYAQTTTVEGKTLKLVGAGLREKWFFNVYTMGQYTESGACGAKAQYAKDEVRYFRIDMLRDVSAEKMASTLKEAFDNNLTADAPAELKKQVNTFTSYFKKECTKGTKLEFAYIPGTGTTLKQNGKNLGPAIPGKAFADLLWSCYFGNKTCCKDLKKQILGTCK